MSICVDLTGMRFGKLIVVKKLKINPHREMEWLCLCDCGNEYVSTSNRLTTGKTTCCHSCAMKKISDTNKKHGCEPRKLWNMFQNIIIKNIFFITDMVEEESQYAMNGKMILLHSENGHLIPDGMNL